MSVNMVQRRMARGVLHRPSIVVAGVSGISPNNSLELVRDTDVAALA
jgi:hypothetical protein